MNSEELIAHYRHLARQPLTIVDVETTGHQPPGARVIEVSIIQGSLAEGIALQHTELINPRVRVPPFIERFTGISQAMVDQSPPAEVVWPRCYPLLLPGVLTAHNLMFDYNFLTAECRRYGLRFLKPLSEQLCTVQLARLLLADLPSRSLPDLIQHFKFPIAESHRAGADTLACWYLTQHLLTLILESPDEQLLAQVGQEWLPLSMVANILGLSRQISQRRMAEAGYEATVSRRSGIHRYRRAWVEAVRLSLG